MTSLRSSKPFCDIKIWNTMTQTISISSLVYSTILFKSPNKDPSKLAHKYLNYEFPNPMFWEFHIAPTRHNDFLINMELVSCHKQPFNNIFAYGLHIVVNSHCQGWYTNSHHLLNMFCKLILKQVCKSTFQILYKTTSPSQNLEIQLAGTYKSKIGGCSSFIQALNSTLVCTFQQWLRHFICYELERFDLSTLLARYGTRMKFTNFCIDSRLDQWLSIIVKWKPWLRPL
jgi:hypothetical protein